MNCTGIRWDMYESLFTHAMIFRFPSYLQRRVFQKKKKTEANNNGFTLLLTTYHLTVHVSRLNLSLYAVYNTH